MMCSGDYGYEPCDVVDTSESIKKPEVEKVAHEYGISVRDILFLIGDTEEETHDNIQNWRSENKLDVSRIVVHNKKAASAHHRAYGYDIDGVEIDSEQAVIQEIHDMRISGTVYRLISDKLNRDGHKTARGLSWTHAIVRAVHYKHYQWSTVCQKA